MKEIRGARTEGSKRFIKDDKSALVTRAHSGKIHYLNKLGVGDSKGDLRSIDLTLIPCEDGWRSEYNACHLHIPALADDVATFRDVYGAKDQTTSIQADCKPVKGELIPDGIEGLTTANCVVYLDAFQDGTDLIYVPFTTGLKKIVRIREKKAWKNDKKFTFFLQLPDESEIYRTSSKDEYKLNPKKKVLDSPRGSAIRTKDGDTTIRPFKAWSTDGEAIDIKVEYAPDDGDGWSTFTKIVSAEFIAAATGEVFTDATLAYTTSADGSTYKGASTWSGARNAAVGNGASSTGDEAKVAGGKPTQYHVSRGLFPYNIGGAGVPITDVVSACQTYFKVKKVSNPSYVADVCLVEWTQAGSPPTIVTGSFNDFGTTLWSDDHPTGTSGAVLNHDFNSAGLAALQAVVAAGGWLKVCCRDYTRDYLDAAPPGGWPFPPWNTYLYTSESAGYDPYLTITHAPPAGAVTGALMVQSF